MYFSDKDIRTMHTSTLLPICALVFVAGVVLSQPDPSQFAPATWCDEDAISHAIGLPIWEACQAYKKAVFDQKVKLTLYYESRCPGCKEVITTMFPTLYQQFKGYVEFEFVPYGNAGRTATGFDCQHGEKECQLNQVDTCAIHFINDKDVLMDFIVCRETISGDVSVEDHLSICFKNASVRSADQKSISDCWNSELGRELEEAMANRTDAAWPKSHGWVPWIAINDASTLAVQAPYLADTDQDSIAQFGLVLCNAYQGDQRPPTCQPRTTDFKGKKPRPKIASGDRRKPKLCLRE